VLQITECRVRTVSSKRKVTEKDELVGRRSPEEITFLDDIVMSVVHSGARGDEELMRSNGSRLVLSTRAVRDELKATVKEEGLPELYFSPHSLRKGAITHMRALGASEDDRRERGNFAEGSTVMNSTYDYAVTGLRPSASNSLERAGKPTINDLRRLVPAVRQSRRASGDRQ
jgi:integrase